jgi:hypothetical protein
MPRDAIFDKALLGKEYLAAQVFHERRELHCSFGSNWVDSNLIHRLESGTHNNMLSLPLMFCEIGVQTTEVLRNKGLPWRARKQLLAGFRELA